MEQKTDKKSSETKFTIKSEIDNIQKFLDEINDERTVLMAPSLGSADAPDKKMRLYSWGGRILDLSTTLRANNDMLQDKNYDKYTSKKLLHGNIPYSIINKEMLCNAIEAARNRAVGDEKGRHGKQYMERAVESRLVKLNRNYAEYKAPEAIIVDMEFRMPEKWITHIVKYRGKPTTGKPDLIVYDKVDKSFGIVELKYRNQSCGNMEKHFTDFYNICHSENIDKIKKEFTRKMHYLIEYGQIDKVPNSDLCDAIGKDIWKAFLFVEGDSKESRRLFDSADIDAELIDRDDFGYQYVSSLEDSNIEYTREKFFEYLKK